jgi:hypothetical protein
LFYHWSSDPIKTFWLPDAQFNIFIFYAIIYLETRASRIIIKENKTCSGTRSVAQTAE